MSYKNLLNSKFKILERSSLDDPSGRPQRQWGLKATDIDGRLEPISAEERKSMGSYFHAVSHKIWLDPDTNVSAEDIIIPDGISCDPLPAYDVKGIINRQNRIMFALVEETQVDAADDYC